MATAKATASRGGPSGAGEAVEPVGAADVTGATWRQRAPDLLLFSVVLLAPHLAGTVHLWSWLGVLVLSVAALALLGARGAPVGHTHPLLLLLLGLTGLAVLAPLVPLPSGLVQRLSPVAFDTWSLGAPEIAAGGGWAPLHQAPGEGRFEALRWLATSTFVLACAARAHDPAWRRSALVVVVVAAALAAASCLAHTGLEEREIYGLYAPRMDRRSLWLAPLVSENHWAAYTALGATTGLGMVMVRRSPSPVIWLAAGSGAVLVGLLVTNPSRGGLVGFAASLTALIVWRSVVAWRSSKGALRRGFGALVGAACLAALVTGTAVLVKDRTPLRVDPLSGDMIGEVSGILRIQLLPDAWQVVAAHPVSGVGRGASADVLPRFRTVEGTPLAGWMETLPVQLVVDHGPVLGLALGLLLLVLLVSALVEAARRPAVMGAAAALVGLLVHELADFAIQTGAVLLTVALLAAVVFGREDRTGSPRRLLVASVSALLLALLLGSGLGHWSAPRCQERLDALAADAGQALPPAIEAEHPWHPSSFPFALSYASGYVVREQPELALGWLNRAQYLAPGHPWPHLATARLLADQGYADQALLEYRIAADRDWSDLGRPVLEEALQRWPDPRALRQLVPLERPEAAAHYALWLGQLRRPLLASALAEVAWERAPDNPVSQVAWAAHLERRGQQVEAAELATRVAGDRDMPPGTRLLASRIVLRSGGPLQGLEFLRALGEQGALQPDGWLALGEAEVLYGDRAQAHVAFRRVRTFGWKRATAASLMAEARMELEEGRSASALQFAERAAATDDRLVDAHRLLAELQEHEGRYEDALLTVLRLLEFLPGDEQALARRDRLALMVSDRTSGGAER